MDMKLARTAAAAALLAGLIAFPATVAAAACPIDLPQGSEPVTLDPAGFVGQIDNVYWPMAPETRWVYRETDRVGNAQRVTVTVTSRTKTIVGIEATVVHDKVTERGEVVENTFDWYAQDDCGNVWYLGENTKEYEDGKLVSTEGSWEAGVDGAQPGVIVPAEPVDDMTYRQEYSAGEAEDMSEVLSTDEQAQVPFGHFTDVLLTKDFTPLEPRVLEYKLYAPSVGPVLVLGVSGGAGREGAAEDASTLIGCGRLTSTATRSPRSMTGSPTCSSIRDCRVRGRTLSSRRPSPTSGRPIASTRSCDGRRTGRRLARPTSSLRSPAR